MPTSTPDFDPVIAMYLLVAKRVLASARIFVDALSQQNIVDATLACVDLVGACSSSVPEIGLYLSGRCAENEAYANEFGAHAVDRYNALLYQASGGDRLVLLGEEFDEQLRIINELYGTGD